MHSVLTVAGMLGLIALAFGQRAAAIAAAGLLGLLALFAVAVAVALLDVGGPLDWIPWLLGMPPPS